MLKKKVYKAVALLLTAALLFSLAGCGGGRVRARSVTVNNAVFFEDMFSLWHFGEHSLEEDAELFDIACAFSGTYEEFERQFLYCFDSYIGMECRLEITNKTKEPITATGIRTDNNGFESTYVSTRLGNCRDVEIPAGETETVSFLFLGNGSLYTNEEFINKIFPQMPMELLYTDASGASQAVSIQFKSVDPEP